MEWAGPVCRLKLVESQRLSQGASCSLLSSLTAWAGPLAHDRYCLLSSGGVDLADGCLDSGCTPISAHHLPQLPSRLPSAHTYVERARVLASRWSAPLYERPGRQDPCLLGFAWVDGRRDGSFPAHATTVPHSRTAPPPSRSRSAPAGGMLWTKA